MLFLAISVLLTSFLYILFKAFIKLKVDLFPAVVVNYFSASTIAWLFIDSPVQPFYAIEARPLFTLSLVLGLGFLTVFFLLGKTTQMIGVAGSTIVSRMSMVIPACYGIYILHEGVTVWKVVGILLGICAIYFVVHQDKKDEEENNKLSLKEILIPLLAFIGTGTVDLGFKVASGLLTPSTDMKGFMAFSYSSAFCIGIVSILFNKSNLQKLFSTKNLLWGALLGAFNYFSLYFFMLALEKIKLGGSVVFPLNSISIVLCSTLISVLIFKEKLGRKNILGILIALLAIALITK